VDRGAHPEWAILGISLHGLVSMLTRFLWGWATNRFPIRRVLLCIAIYGSLVCPLPFFVSGDPLILYGGVIAVGIGGFVATNQLLWPVYFGRAHLGAITGFVRPFQTGVASLAPLMVPLLYERTGDYNIPIAIVTVGWMLFAVLLLLTPKGTPK
jgi:OFA family oxalate/formate antiporter-like MFS transporter